MGKILNIFLVACVLFSFTGCGQNTTDTQKQADVQKQVDELKEQVSKLKDEQDGVPHVEKNKEVVTVKADVKVEKKMPLNEAVITIDNPKDGTSISQDPLTLSGTVSDGATKITVTANAGTKNEDVYTLSTFKQNSKKFTYKASKKFGNMISGLNTYEFKAFFKDGSIKTTRIMINFSK